MALFDFIFKPTPKKEDGGLTLPADFNRIELGPNGQFAKGGQPKMRSHEEYAKLVAEKEALVKTMSDEQVAEKWNEWYVENNIQHGQITAAQAKDYRKSLAASLVENELTEEEHDAYFEKGGNVSGKKLSPDRLEEAYKSYVSAVLWTEVNPDTDDNFAPNYSIENISQDSKEKIKKDIQHFYGLVYKAIEESEMDDEQLGFDLLITRNGRIFGFKDRGYDEEISEELTKAAKAMGKCYFKVGDDGEIYVSGGKEYARGGAIESSYDISNDDLLRLGKPLTKKNIADIKNASKVAIYYDKTSYTSRGGNEEYGSYIVPVPTEMDFVKNDEARYNNVIEIGTRFETYIQDMPVEKIKQAFSLLYNYSFEISIIKTIANQLKPGYYLQANWIVGNNNESIEKVNYVCDQLRLRVLNAEKEVIGQYIVEQSTVPDGSTARMVKRVTEYATGGKLQNLKNNPPEWHRVQLAKKAVKMNPAMATIMGVDIEDAKKTLDKYGVKYAAGGFLSRTFSKANLDKAKQFANKGIAKGKEGIERAKGEVEWQVHKNKRKIALDVLIETAKQKGVTKSEENALNKAANVVSDVYANGGSLGSILPPEYCKPFRLKGNGRREYNIFHSNSISDLRQAARQLFPEMSYEEHKKLASEFAKKHYAANKKYIETVEKAFKEQFGREMNWVFDCKISGVCRDEFSEETKDKIRKELTKANKYESALDLHNAVLRNSDKVERYADGGSLSSTEIPVLKPDATWDEVKAYLNWLWVSPFCYHIEDPAHECGFPEDVANILEANNEIVWEHKSDDMGSNIWEVYYLDDPFIMDKPDAEDWVNAASREHIIKALKKHDRNGTYTDQEQITDYGRPATDEELKKLVWINWNEANDVEEGEEFAKGGNISRRPKMVRTQFEEEEFAFKDGGKAKPNHTEKSREMRAVIRIIQKQGLNPAEVSPALAYEVGMDNGFLISAKEAKRIAQGFGYEGSYKLWDERIADEEERSKAGFWGKGLAEKFEKMDKDELIQYCKNHNIAHATGWTKESLISCIDDTLASRYATGGSIAKSYIISPFKNRKGVEGIIETSYDLTQYKDCTEAEAIQAAKDLFDSSPEIVQVEVIRSGKKLGQSKKIAQISSDGSVMKY